MKNIIKVGALSLLLCGGLTACDSFFDSVPGVQYDLEGTFSNRQKTEQFLNNVYSYVPDETQERWPTRQVPEVAFGLEVRWNRILHGRGILPMSGQWELYMLRLVGLTIGL